MKRPSSIIRCVALLALAALASARVVEIQIMKSGAQVSTVTTSALSSPYTDFSSVPTLTFFSERSPYPLKSLRIDLRDYSPFKATKAQISRVTMVNGVMTEESTRTDLNIESSGKFASTNFPSETEATCTAKPSLCWKPSYSTTPNNYCYKFYITLTWLGNFVYGICLTTKMESCAESLPSVFLQPSFPALMNPGLAQIKWTVPQDAYKYGDCIPSGSKVTVYAVQTAYTIETTVHSLTLSTGSSPVTLGIKYSDSINYVSKSYPLCVVLPPTVPTPLISGSIDYMNPYLSWKTATFDTNDSCNKASCSISYMVRTWVTPDNKALKSSTESSTIVSLPDSYEGKKLYWDVTAKQTCYSQDMSTTSSVAYLIPCRQPATPVLLYPLNSTIYFNMNWAGLCIGTFYGVVESKKLSYINSINPAVSPQNFGALEMSDDYTVSITAMLTNGLSNSATGSFVVCNTISPSSPILVYPDTGSYLRYDQLSSKSITFTYIEQSFQNNCEYPTSEKKTTIKIFNSTNSNVGQVSVSAGIESVSIMLPQYSGVVETFNWTAFQSYGNLVSATSLPLSFIVCYPQVPQFLQKSAITFKYDVENSTVSLVLPKNSITWGQCCGICSMEIQLTIGANFFNFFPSSDSEEIFLLPGLIPATISAKLQLANSIGINEQYSFVVAFVSPSGLYIKTPANGYYSSGANSIISWDLSSWGSQPDSYKAFILFDGNSPLSMTEVAFFVGTIKQYTYTFTPGLHYFKIVAVNAQSLKTSSLLSRIEIGGCSNSYAPSAPNVISPADAFFSSSSSISLSWLASEDVGANCASTTTTVKYKIVIQSVTTNEVTVLTTTDTRNSPSISVLFQPKFGDIYLWSIQASNDNFNTFSSTPNRTLSICYFAGIVISNVSPTSGKRLTSLPVDLTWSLSTTCRQATQTISIKSLSSSVKTYVIPSSATKYSFDGVGFTTDDNIQWWINYKVNAASFNGPSSYLQTCINDIPPTPEVISPASNIFFTSFYGDTTPLFNLVWRKQEMCQGYEISYSVNANSSNYQNSLLYSGTQTGYTGNAWVTNTTRVNWVVFAKNFKGTSVSASRTISFCIEKKTIAATLNYPSGEIRRLNGSVEFSWVQTSFGESCVTNAQKVYSLVITGNNIPKKVMNVTIVSEQEGSTRTLIVENLPSGTYSWKITKSYGSFLVDSSSSSFVLCAFQKPDIPTLLNPPNNSPYSFIPEFRWNIVNWNAACGSTTFDFLLGSSAATISNYASFDSSVTALDLPSLVNSTTYYWQVIANNGDIFSPSEIRSFVSCKPVFPKLAQLAISPSNVIESTSSQQYRVNFTFSPLLESEMGSFCRLSGVYPYSTVKIFNRFGELLYNNSNLANEMHTHTYPLSSFGPLKVDYSTTNADGFISKSSLNILYCKKPLVVNLLSPEDGQSNFKTYMMRFEWENSGNIQGYSCDWNVIYDPSLYVQVMEFVDEQTSSSSYEQLQNETTVTLMETRITKDSTFGSLNQRLKPNTKYKWRVANGNGDPEMAFSVWRTFTTKKVDCTVLDCKYGKCSDVDDLCICDDGTSGTSCKEYSSGLSVGLTAAIAGASGFFLIALLFLGVLWRRRANKGKLQIPIFDNFRFVLPTGIDDEQETLPEEEVIEKVKADASNDFEWARGLLKKVLVTESDQLCTSLVYLFEKQGQSLEFILSLVKHEIEETESKHVLFRSNSNAAKCFRIFSRMIGLEYLFHVLAPILSKLVKEDSGDDVKVVVKGEATVELSDSTIRADSYELNPELLGDDEEDVESNVLSLQVVCTLFATQLKKTSRFCPPQFKKLCSFIKAEVVQKFSDVEVSQMISAFMFLRFFIAAIAVPESFGILPKSPSKNLRRKLILISKVLANLSTQVSFGAKEDFMSSMNNFLKENSGMFDDYLLSLTEETTSALPINKHMAVPQKHLQYAAAIAGQADKKTSCYVPEEAKSFWNS